METQPQTLVSWKRSRLKMIHFFFPHDISDSLHFFLKSCFQLVLFPFNLKNLIKHFLDWRVVDSVFPSFSFIWKYLHVAFLLKTLCWTWKTGLTYIFNRCCSTVFGPPLFGVRSQLNVNHWSFICKVSFFSGHSEDFCSSLVYISLSTMYPGMLSFVFTLLGSTDIRWDS